MKKGFLAVVLAAAVSGCTSVESATVASNEVTATGGEAVAIIQASSLGWTLIFHIVDIVSSDLEDSRRTRELAVRHHTESWVEEAGVMSPELAARGVVGRHFGS